MAIDNEIKIGMTVDDGGSTKKRIKDAEALKSAYDSAASSATKIGGTAGSRAMAAKAMPMGSEAAMTGQDYRGAQGIAGGVTGGMSSRDFAKQAQGLGGLVHVYATFAANLFAVSAAFTALQNAADTTNMIKGLDQLGATSGKALGSLSKRIVEVTDGAVSLRDAMTATAQATSAGMTSANLERLASVAKTASQALGISTPDALSRLSRGISKIEPELLDELGIFVKVDKANQDYAASINKTVSSLTDFEKRQAFALAVLKEGEDKFKNIQIDANPYSKLLATIKDVAQSVLESVNKILGPLVNYLSENSSTVLALMGVVTTYLLNKAVPAITQYSEAIRKASEEERNKLAANLQDKQRSFSEQIALTNKLQAIEQEATLKADALTNRTEASEKRALSTKSQYAKSVNDILKSVDTYNEITETQIQHIETLGNKNTKISQIYKELAANIRATQQSYLDEADAKKASEKATEALKKAMQDQMSIQKELNALAVQEKLAQAKVSGREAMDKQGLVSGISKLFTEIGSSGAKFSDKIKAGLGGGLELIGSKLVGLINPITTLLQSIAVLGTAWDMLSGFLGKNAKQAEETQKAFEQLRETSKNVDNVLNDLSKRDPLYRISTSALLARANAFDEIATAAEKTFNKIEAQVNTANWFDKLVDTAKADVGLGLLKQSATETAYSINQAFKVLPESIEKANLASAIKDLAGVSPEDLKGLKQALAESPEAFMDLAPKLIEKVKATGQEINNLAASGKKLDDTFAATTKVVKDLFTALQPTDNIAKIGYQILQIGQSLGESIVNTDTAVSKLKEIATDADKLVLFKPEDARYLAKNSALITEITTKYAGLKSAEETYAKAVKDTRTEISKLEDQKTGDDRTTKRLAKLKAELKGLEEGQQLSLNLKLDAQKQLQPYLDKLTDTQNSAFIRGAQLVQESIQNGFTKANINVQKTFSDILGDTVAAAELKTSLQKQEIDIQIRQIDVQLDLAKNMTELKLVQEEANLLAKQKKLEEPGSKATEDDKAKIAAALVANQAAQKTLSSFTGGNLLAQILPTLKAKTSETLTPQQNAAISAARSGAQALLPLAQTIGGGESQKAGLEASKTSLDILLDRKKIVDENFRIQQESLKRDVEKLNIDKKINDIASKGLLYLDAESAARQSRLASADLDLRNKQELLAINKQIADAEFASKDPRADKQSRDSALKAVKELTDRKTTLESQQRQKGLVADLDAQENLRKASVETFKFEIGLEYQKSSLRATNQQAYLSLKTQELDLLAQLDAFYGEDISKKKTLLDLESQDAASKAKVNELTNAYILKQTDLVERLSKPGQSEAQIKSLQDQFKANDDAYESAKSNEEKLNEFVKQRIASQGELNALLAKQSEEMKRIVTASESLGNLFGDQGASVGSALKSMVEMRNKQDEIILKKNEALKQAKTSADIAKIEAKAQKDLQTNELNGAIATISSTKKVFKEKTAGYKVLDGLEKAMHVQRLAMWVTENAATIAALPGKIAGGVAELFNQGGFAGFAGAAAFLAIMAGLGFSSGKSARAPAGFTAAEQQKVQGTGVKYNAVGNLVESRGGVTGDVTAVANSVKTSIDELSKEFFGMLGSGSSRIIRALTAIEENTGNTVKAMLGKLIGLGAGSAFGTMEGSSGSGIMGSLFGKSSTTIADAGVAIKGTLDNLSKGIGDFKQYENVVRSSSSLFGLIKSTSYRTNIKDLEANIVNAFSDIFGNVSEALVASAEALEGSGKRAADLIKEIPVELKVSVKGMSGTEAADAIMSAISVELNAAALKIFPYIEQYNKIGEEMYQTVARIVKNGETVKTGLSMIGKSITGLSLEATVAAQEDLISKVGGVDKFSSGIETYFDNFFDASTKFDFRLKSLTQKFKEANVILPKSKAEYTSLVNSLDAANADQRTQLAFLINNAEAYNNLLSDQNSALSDTISKLEDSVAKFKDFAKTVRDFRDSLLLSGSSIATPTEKYVEAKTQFEATYASALAGDKDAMSKLTSISQTFLDMSKQLFASSGSYTADFNMVIQKLDEAQISALANADVEQLKLDYAKNTVDLLTTIDANIAAIAGVSAHARGGVASGLSLVGENGPELVDFTNPGRVYTAEQTADMFTYNAGMGSGISSMVTEIRQLREEVTQLRKEQQKQTGDLIMSNYDANQKAADDISAAVVDSSSNSAWDARITAQIK